MKINVARDGNTNFLSLDTEKLDSKIAPDLKSQVILLANDEKKGALVIDLGNISFADSSGLSALLLAHRLYRESGNALVLCNLSDRVEKLLEISQLTNVFTIVPNRDEAVKLLG
jgi:anti-sigma B factor antagonist